MSKKQKKGCMDRTIFDRYFSLGEVSVGPTIISGSVEGNYIGKVKVYSTKKNIFFESRHSFVYIRDYYNTLTEELNFALKNLSIEHKEFEKFINDYYLIEWQTCFDNNKPDVSSLLLRNHP